MPRAGDGDRGQDHAAQRERYSDVAAVAARIAASQIAVRTRGRSTSASAKYSASGSPQAMRGRQVRQPRQEMDVERDERSSDEAGRR